MLPFKNIPNKVVIEMVIVRTIRLNTFPPTNGISTKISPRTIRIGLQINYKKS